MNMHEIRPNRGARVARRRVGRGHGSGRGKTAGRGSKGQKARAGGGPHPRFEGGQLPIIQRLPHKRGFTNIFRVEYAEVNVGQLSRLPAGAEVGPEAMVQARLIKSTRHPVKVLGHGVLEHALKVAAHKFTESARAKIEAAGGTVVELGSASEESQKNKDQAAGTARAEAASD